MRAGSTYLSVVLAILCLSAEAMGADLNSIGSRCADRVGNCDYYLCRNELQACGEGSYYVRFGYRYCTFFEDTLSPQLTTPEQAWIQRVGSCLQRKVEEGIPVELSCLDSEEAAIASHTPCYLETGFCWMPMSLKLKLLEIVRPELHDPRMRKTFLKILKSCGLLRGHKSESEKLIRRFLDE